MENVPTELDLWDGTDDQIGPDSAAWRLVAELEDITGIGWVTAGKLLARKRPRLIPVYDRDIHTALGRDGEIEFWQSLRDVLAANPSIRERPAEIRAEAGIPNDITLLRVLDVAMWMRADGQPEPTPDATSDPLVR